VEVKAILSAARKLRTAMTFPRTRAAAKRLLHGRRLRALLWCLASLLTLATYRLLRGGMDDVGMPVHGAEIETGLFGTLPTLWLQHHIYTLWPGPLEWGSVVVHWSWFLVPLLTTVFVTWKRIDRVGSLFRWWIALLVIALPLFTLFPLRPPWMENEEVIRVLALRFGGEISDSNPVAAMPSLHVAVPLLLSLWFFRERWKAPGMVMLAYSALVSFEVVFSGEHYVVDIMGAGVVALAVALLAKVEYRRVLRPTFRRLARGYGPMGQPVLGPSLGAVANAHAHGCAQAYKDA